MFFVCLFVFLFFVTLWNYEICEKENAIKQCNFENNYDVIAYRKDCSSAPMLKFFYGPQDFRMGADLYQKLPFLAIFGSVSPHFLSHNGKIWCEGADLRVPSECQIL